MSLLFPYIFFHQDEWQKEQEDLSKDIANYKVQLEAKNAALMQALFKMEQCQKMTSELSALLKKSDLERNKYMNESRKSKARIDKLESEMEELAFQHSENVKIREQLSHVLSELKTTQRELLNKETELVAARDSEFNALKMAEQMETAFHIEKEKKEELLQKVKDLNEAEKEKFVAVSEKDHKLELAMKAISQAQEQVEDLRNQVEILQGLSNESACNAIQNSNQLDQAVYLEALEMELKILKQEHENAKKEVNDLNNTTESLRGELHKAKSEINKLKERDAKAQVEIAFLISRLKSNDHSNPEGEEGNIDKYNSKAKNQVQGSEVAFLKKELAASAAKIGELRARAEQALSRAELAEKAKAALEDIIRRQREYSQRRRGVKNGLQEELSIGQNSPSSSDTTSKSYHPLGKVLNMRF